MSDTPQRAPESARREIAGARTSDIYARDEDRGAVDSHPTEPSPPPVAVEEEPAPSTSPMRVVPLLRLGEASGEGPQSSRPTLVPPPSSAQRAAAIASVRHPSPLDGLWFPWLRSLARRLESGEPSASESEAARDAQLAAFRVIAILVGKLQTFGDAVTRGERWTIVADEVRRDGGTVMIEITIAPLDGDVAGMEANHAG